MIKKTKQEIPVKEEPKVSPVPAAEAEAEEPPYVFPGKAQCPRCGTWDTSRTGAHKNHQYRRCDRPICRRKFTVIVPEHPEKKQVSPNQEK